MAQGRSTEESGRPSLTDTQIIVMLLLLEHVYVHDVAHALRISKQRIRRYQKVGWLIGVNWLSHAFPPKVVLARNHRKDFWSQIKAGASPAVREKIDAALAEVALRDL